MSKAELKVCRQPDGSPEVFYSLQGEGASIGRPAVFLRLASCNLACRWCDTRYSWERDPACGDNSETAAVKTAQLAERIRRHHCRRLVVTGGEPLLQQDGIAHLLASLQGEGMVTEIETNGTITPSAKLREMVRQWNVSPKLPSSGITRERREAPECLSMFRKMPGANFKFAVLDEEDLGEADALVQRYRMDIDRVILMPVADNVADLNARGRWLAEECKARGYTFSTRLHILLWGNARAR